jgi:cytochrome c-type biogenesis protein CcmH
MTGWLIVTALALLTLAGVLAFAPARKQLWPIVAAASVLALAGYAWQGNPDQLAAPAQTIAAKTRAAEALIAMRADMDPTGGLAKQWLITADSYARSGRYQYSAAFIEAGLRQYPRNGDLWAGLGLVLLLAGDNQMSPPAKMAFAKAREYAPLNRSPDYFEGLVELFEGRPANTIRIWQKLVDGAPDGAVWKPKLESQLEGLISMLQRTAAENVNTAN